MKTDGGRERRLQGLGIAPGVAVGRAFITDSGAIVVSERRLEPGEVEEEQRRLAQAV
jgi:phosphoenolpyruvate-protein kinase (PTS system EI component)